MVVNTTQCRAYVIYQPTQPFQCLKRLLGTFRNANKDCICSYLVMGLPWESRWKMNANYSNFSPFHQNPFNNLLPNKILPFFHIQLFINHMLIHFLKNKFPNCHHMSMQLWPSFDQHVSTTNPT